MLLQGLMIKTLVSRKSSDNRARPHIAVVAHWMSLWVQRYHSRAGSIPVGGLNVIIQLIMKTNYERT